MILSSGFSNRRNVGYGMVYKHFEYIFYRPDDDFYLNLIGP